MKQRIYSIVFMALLSIPFWAYNATAKDIAKAQTQRTKELIRFRDIPLGVPDVIPDLQKLCQTAKFKSADNCDNYFKAGDSAVLALKYGGLRQYNEDSTNDDFLEKCECIFVSFSLAEDSRIDHISMYPTADSVTKLVSMLKKKYGQPKVHGSTVHTKLGKPHALNIFTWNDELGNRLQVHSAFQNINQGMVIFQSATEVARIAAENKEEEDEKSKL